MTINEFAAYLGVRPASVSNYSKRHEVPRSYAALAVMFGDAADRGVAVSEVLGRYGVVPLITEKKNIHQLDIFRAGRGSKEARR